MLFISYSSKDVEPAKAIMEYLEKKGIKCWIAFRDITPGKSYPAQIVQAIKDSSGVILVVSKSINNSNHILSEVSRAFDLKKEIFPFIIDDVVFSDDFIYYLGQFQWIKALGGIEDGLESLYKSLNYHNHIDADVEKESVPIIKTCSLNKNVHLATYEELVAKGYSSIDIAQNLVDNDYKLYPDMSDENEGTPEQWAEYLSTYPETFRYLIDSENRIVGNWSFLAVSEEYHAEKLRKGELTEDTFTLDETEYLLLPGDYVGYLLNLSVNTEYNTADNLNLLLTSFAEQLLTFAEKDIFFSDWYVNVFRKDHEAMYKRLGFKFFMNNKRYGKVYHLNCIPDKYVEKKKRSNNPLFSYSERLMKKYYEHFM